MQGKKTTSKSARSSLVNARPLLNKKQTPTGHTPSTRKKKKTRPKNFTDFSRWEISTKSNISYKPNNKPVLIIAGEHSGDLLGAELMDALASFGIRKFIGTGGVFMLQKGLHIYEHIENMNIVGLIEAFRAYRRLKALADLIIAQALEQKVELAILIDYPGFNLRLAAKLRQTGIRVIYMVSPQIWAWHYSRIKTIKKNVDLMLPLFPFEELIYRAEGVECHCIGHPLVDRIPREIIKEKKLPIPKKNVKLTIGILPGSRSNEIRYLLDDMLQAAKLLGKDYKNCRFLIAGVSTRWESLIVKKLEKHKDLACEYYIGSSLRIMQASDLLLVASGTATLEGLYFRKPMVLVYRTGWLNTFIASLVTRSRFIGIVNILARRQIIPELLQTEVNPENIYQAAKEIIENNTYRQKIKRELEYVRQQLSAGKPATKAALYIMRYLQGQRKQAR